MAIPNDYKIKDNNKEKEVEDVVGLIIPPNPYV